MVVGVLFGECGIVVYVMGVEDFVEGVVEFGIVYGGFWVRDGRVWFVVF